MRAHFIRYEREAVVKRNGARYEAKCAIILIAFSTNSAEGFEGKKAFILSALSDRTPSILEPEGTKYSPPQVVALRRENEQLKRDLAKARDDLARIRKAGASQKEFERSAFSLGKVVMLVSRAEARIMRGITWRPVATSLVYDSQGDVVHRDKKPVFQLTYHQLGRSGPFCRWIRYEVRAGGQLIDVSWRSSGAQLYRSLEDVKRWVDSQNTK